MMCSTELTRRFPPRLSRCRLGSPLPSPDEAIISVAVERFDDAKAQQLIDKWNEEGRKTDWTVAGLQERVGLRIFERFEIEWRTDGVGVRISARNRDADSQEAV